jgi:hypothetical protein
MSQPTSELLGEPTPHGWLPKFQPWPGAPPDGFPTNTTSPALVSSLLLAPGRRRLFGLQGVNNNAAATFVQLFDTESLPSNGAVPTVIIRAAGSDNWSGYFGSVGRWFDKGIFMVNSSTLATLTISTADLWVDAQYY